MGSTEQHAKLLQAWQVAEKKAETLREFQAKGGEHRMTINVESEFFVAGGIIDELMTGEGYRATLTTLIRKAEHDAGLARLEFLNAATAEAIADGVEGSK